ncbi:MAG TPA: hypothetical protein VGJ44_02785 [Kribbellaceae bacterium]|jgi:hypothetical protein
MRHLRGVLRTAAIAAAVTVSTAGAEAVPSAGDDFGQHVRVCAQQVGFSAEHNPGMHHGAAGWDGATCDA